MVARRSFAARRTTTSALRRCCGASRPRCATRRATSPQAPARHAGAYGEVRCLAKALRYRAPKEGPRVCVCVCVCVCPGAINSPGGSVVCARRRATEKEPGERTNREEALDGAIGSLFLSLSLSLSLSSLSLVCICPCRSPGAERVGAAGADALRGDAVRGVARVASCAAICEEEARGVCLRGGRDRAWTVLCERAQGVGHEAHVARGGARGRERVLRRARRRDAAAGRARRHPRGPRLCQRAARDLCSRCMSLETWGFSKKRVCVVDESRGSRACTYDL